MEIEVLFIIDLENETDDIFIPMILKGYGDEFDEVMLWLDEQISDKITSSITLPRTHPTINCQLVWSSSNEGVINTNGVVVRDTDDNIGVLLSCDIEYNGEMKTYTKYVYILGRTDKEKIALVSQWLNGMYGEYIDEETKFYLTDERYNSRITWTSRNESIISDELVLIEPLFTTTVAMDVAIGIGSSSTNFSYVFKVRGKEYNDIWEKITIFLEKINIPEIKNQKFSLYGYEVGYENVPTENIGYLPFYDETEMVIIQDILPDNSPLKPNRMRTATKYIVIHNTGMAAPSATAKGLNDYIHSTDRVASWHFSIDDKETYQELKLGEVGWHAGETNGNNYGIGIESCVYQGVDFNKVLRRLAKLTASLLIEYNLNLSDVKQHYDFSGKNCPQVIRQANRWGELLGLIQLEYFAQTELQGVQFNWKSLTPEIMDDEGTVINHPGSSALIEYEVEVIYGGEKRIFNYSSILLPKNN